METKTNLKPHPLFGGCTNTREGHRPVFDMGKYAPHHAHLSLQPDEVEVVVFHQPSLDAFQAVRLAYRFNSQIEFIPLDHRDNELEIAERLAGKKVLFLGITPKRIRLGIMADFLILGHDKQAFDDLKGVDARHKVFDKSGGQLADDYFQTGHAMARMTEAISEYYLGEFTQDNKNIVAGLRSLPPCAGCWPWDDDDLFLVAERGAGVNGYTKYKVAEHVAKAVCCTRLAVPAVWAVNCTDYTLINDICTGILSVPGREKDVAAVWSVDVAAGLINFSFRSGPGGPDVDQLARGLSTRGGGHEHAAGCPIGIDRFADIFVPARQ